MTHVLLVDDDYITNLELREHLQDAGFEVETAYCGLGALAAIQRRPPRSLVTAQNFGPGPDGFEVAHFARALRPDLRVVFISGHRLSKRPTEEAMSAFIAKPYRGEQIVDALRLADARAT